MKIAVSIPDPLFERADALARRLGKSRSQVYREALADYLARREPAAVTRTLDAVVDELGEGIDDWTAASGRAALGRSEW
jgi:metal-responsive CopG/Arc/MetJ family transcriptional regulator